MGKGELVISVWNESVLKIQKERSPNFQKSVNVALRGVIEFLYKYAMTLSTHLICVGGLFDFHCRSISRWTKKANASNWPDERFSDVTPNIAIIGSLFYLLFTNI